MVGAHIGEQIGGYRVIELVGTGGMGRVYRAVQPRLERTVALKVIRPELAADEAFRDRFRREARVAASIDHPGVVPVYEADEVDGVLFVAMRWINGCDLRRTLAAEGPLELERAIHLLSQIAGGLAAAHRVGLVHRDIKPANVLVDGDRAYLCDFGLARSTSGAGDSDSTQTAGFMGTVDYAAPEVLDGAPADVRGDIYSLGCVLYELLTGSVPYPVESLLAKLKAHAAGRPAPPSELRADLPRAFDRVVLTALAKDPAKRFGTPGQLAAAAQEALEARASRRVDLTRSRPSALPSSRRLAVLAAAGLLVVAALVLALRPGRATHPRPPGGHHASSRLAAGRPLPSVAALPPCHDTTIGSPRVCGLTGRGVLALQDEHGVLRMSTMDIKVNDSLQARLLPGLNGTSVQARRGDTLIVIDATITNRTARPRVFEPDARTPAGRQTVLWLYRSGSGSELPYRGPQGADYSVQDRTVFGALPRPLAGATLYPGRPLSGQLVFTYPAAALRRHPIAFLGFNELGEAFGDERSLGAVRWKL